VPVAAFKAARRVEARRITGGAPKEDSFDLHVDSTPIDLGLVQGFTTALTNVTGTLQAKIDVTGGRRRSASERRHHGRQGRLQPSSPTGVSYTNLPGTDRSPAGHGSHRSHLGDRQSQERACRSPATLAIHERQVGGVAIHLTADDFKVIDNKMGNIRVNSNLAVDRRARRPPASRGTSASRRASLDLDPILAQVGDSAYATKETEYLTGATDTKGQQADARARSRRCRLTSISRCRTISSSRRAICRRPARRSASAPCWVYLGGGPST